MTRRIRQDVGETLIEIIIAIALMGIAVPAIIGAVLVSIDSSMQDRRMAQAQQLLTTWSEHVAKGTVNNAAYGTCASPPIYTSGTFALSSVPSGFSASVGSTDYWSGTAFGAPCASDQGIRRVLLRIHVTAGLYPAFDSDRYVLVRKPCGGSSC
jgi:type II secretory pathway pseudopilin PulG